MERPSLEAATAGAGPSPRWQSLQQWLPFRRYEPLPTVAGAVKASGTSPAAADKFAGGGVSGGSGGGAEERRVLLAAGKLEPSAPTPPHQPPLSLAALACDRLWESGTACLLLAAFIFSVSVLLVKLTRNQVPVLEITLARASLSMAASVAIARARGVPLLGGATSRPWLLVRGATGATAMCLYYASVLLLPMADAVTLFFLNVAFTAVLARLLRGEPLRLRAALGVAASLVGLLLLAHPPFLFGGHAEWGQQRVLGTAAGVASAVFAALAFISIRFVGRAEPALVVALYFHAGTVAISTLPLALGWPQRAALLSGHNAALLVGVAATSFAAQLLLTRGFQLESAGRASALNFTQVLWSYIFGILLLHEHLTPLGAAGSALIAAGVAAVNASGGGASTAVQPARASMPARDAAGAGAGSVVLRVAPLAGVAVELVRASSPSPSPPTTPRGGGGGSDGLKAACAVETAEAERPDNAPVDQGRCQPP